ncbi:putative Mg2+ transporter-C (MgtC) family protein [Pseudomonas sp. TE3786]
MSVWETILATLSSEFSDLNDVEHTTRVTLRMALATILGGLLGWEREQHGKAAGVRTHMLVALGRALFVIAAEQMGAADDAMSRVIQGVVAGIGFLCAGTILKGRDPSQVQGLTTAAGIWLTCAIGITVGLGREATALLGTGFGLIVLNLLPHVISRLEKTPDDKP